MADERERLGKQAESFAASFVGDLGLLDLIIGGLTLYWFRLRYDSLGVLPSTTFAVVDVVLLAAAAALAGKLVALLVVTLMAIIGEFLRLTPIHRRFREAISYYEEVTHRAGAAKLNRLAYATELLTADRTDRRRSLSSSAQRRFSVTQQRSLRCRMRAH